MCKVQNRKVFAWMSYSVETENKLFQFKDYHGKTVLFIVPYHWRVFNSRGGKSYSSIFSDRMDIFWLSVFVKVFKRKVKFRHNRLHAQPYILLRTSTCAAHTCVDHKIDFSFSIVNNEHSFIISIHSGIFFPVYSRACNMLYRYAGLIPPPPPPYLSRGFASCATP